MVELNQQQEIFLGARTTPLMRLYGIDAFKD
jgi:hypothetical protein